MAVFYKPQHQPVSWYGGKFRMIKHLKPIIPEHTIYVEAFAGGASLFWAKPPSKVEVLNDTNGEVINFYYVLKAKLNALRKLLKVTLYSYADYKKALDIYRHPDEYTDVQRAWAFFILCNQSFASKLGSGWGYERKSNKTITTFHNKKTRLIEHDFYTQRLERVWIECRDALLVIRNRDTKEAFFYLDPPYPNTCQGHYKGYTMANFLELLALLETIQGKFIVSSYPYPELTAFVQKNGWFQKSFDQTISARGGSKPRKRKTEVLTANFKI